MTDTTTPPVSTGPQLSQQEIDSGKTMAILSYLPVGPIGLIVAIVCVAQKNNAFSLYHAKQALTLWICAAAGAIISAILMVVCIGALLWFAVGIGAVVLCILGIINANGGLCKPLPLIGQFADKWFGKIQKV